MNMRFSLITRRGYAILTTIALVFGFIPASCYAHVPDAFDIGVRAQKKDQCVTHQLHAKPVKNEIVARLSVPLPKPFTFLPAAIVVVNAWTKFAVLEIPKKLPLAVVRRMRVPLKPMSMPFTPDGFIPYFAAQRDA